MAVKWRARISESPDYPLPTHRWKAVIERCYFVPDASEGKYSDGEAEWKFEANVYGRNYEEVLDKAQKYKRRNEDKWHDRPYEEEVEL